ncbi:MAG: NAD(P)H-dependent oxidoreductase [Candidatus Sabulitectum sp.]|nr:NAD(P)H-dependent oxidoreductase [Candidatus Sabulitectum sp.]
MDDSDTKGLVFSARKGNCLDFASYILGGNRVIHIADYRISPCQRCRYQCFHNKPCPVQDDLHEIFQRISKAERILVVSPVYDSRPPALYYAFQERLPSIWNRNEKGFDLFKGKKIALIVVGNEGAQITLNILHRNYQDLEMEIVTAVKIIPEAYEKGGGISGGLIENRAIRDQMDEIRGKLL